MRSRDNAFKSNQKKLMLIESTVSTIFFLSATFLTITITKYAKKIKQKTLSHYKLAAVNDTGAYAYEHARDIIYFTFSGHDS